MSIEIEAKMRVNDLAELDTKLRTLQARRETDVLEHNTYYDTPEAGLRRAGQGLRLRLVRAIDGSNCEAVLTHKGPRDPGATKTRMETELSVAEPEKAADLLAALGYRPVLAFEKRRSSWRLGECRVDIDTLPHLGDFVEIEGPSETSVMAARHRLDMANVTLITKSYLGLLRTYLEQHGIQTKEVRFGANND